MAEGIHKPTSRNQALRLYYKRQDPCLKEDTEDRRGGQQIQRKMIKALRETFVGAEDGDTQGPGCAQSQM